MILSYFASRRRQRQAAIPALAHIPPSPWRQGWRQPRRNRLAMFCLILLAVMAVWCVLGPVWSPWRDDATDALSINLPLIGTLNLADLAPDLGKTLGESVGSTIGGTIESALASLPVIGGLLNKLLGN